MVNMNKKMKDIITENALNVELDDKLLQN